MNIDADRLANQVKLAYEFMEALHGQALALIKDVETQLAQALEELQCLRPGGYRFAVNSLSLSLERPQATIADYYAVYFRHFAGRVKNTPLDGNVPPIAFLKIVFRERNLEHPEVRFGVLTEVAKPADRADSWPKKFEDIINNITRRSLGDPAWFSRETISQDYQDIYISFAIRGKGVRLADLPDSEAIAERIIDPLLAMYREAAGQS
jgi:hypothetical protein